MYGYYFYFYFISNQIYDTEKLILADDFVKLINILTKIK